MAYNYPKTVQFCECAIFRMAETTYFKFGTYVNEGKSYSFWVRNYPNDTWSGSETPLIFVNKW